MEAGEGCRSCNAWQGAMRGYEGRSDVTRGKGQHVGWMVMLGKGHAIVMGVKGYRKTRGYVAG